MNSDAEKLRDLVMGIKGILFLCLFLFLRLKKKKNGQRVSNNLHCKMTFVNHNITREALLILSDHRNQYLGYKSDKKNYLLNMENKDIGLSHSGSEASTHNYPHKFAEH